MSTCSVDQCDHPAKAKNLCGTHYQRQRRTGDATVVRKPGRPKDPSRSLWRSMMGDDFASPRSFDRFMRANRLADFVAEHEGAEWKTKLHAMGVRPNQSINVSEFLANCEYHAWRVLETYYPPDGDESVSDTEGTETGSSGTDYPPIGEEPVSPVVAEYRWMA